jgi:hypothetical protein
MVLITMVHLHTPQKIHLTALTTLMPRRMHRSHSPSRPPRVGGGEVIQPGRPEPRPAPQQQSRSVQPPLRFLSRSPHIGPAPRCRSPTSPGQTLSSVKQVAQPKDSAYSISWNWESVPCQASASFIDQRSPCHPWVLGDRHVHPNHRTIWIWSPPPLMWLQRLYIIIWTLNPLRWVTFILPAPTGRVNHAFVHMRTAP